MVAAAVVASSGRVGSVLSAVPAQPPLLGVLLPLPLLLRVGRLPPPPCCPSRPMPGQS